MQLSQKERLLLEDLKSEEELCVLKYQSFAQQAQDQELNQLFNKLAGEEQKHYDTVNQFLQGGQPNVGLGQPGQSSQMGQSSGMQSGQSSQMGQSSGQMSQQKMQLNQSQSQSSNGNNWDKNLCTDLLSTEKYVSNTYDTAIFECANPAIRQALQHNQKDEQSHGEQIFNYMNSHGMYQVK